MAVPKDSDAAAPAPNSEYMPIPLVVKNIKQLLAGGQGYQKDILRIDGLLDSGECDTDLCEAQLMDRRQADRHALDTIDDMIAGYFDKNKKGAGDGIGTYCANRPDDRQMTGVCAAQGRWEKLRSQPQ